MRYILSRISFCLKRTNRRRTYNRIGATRRNRRSNRRERWGICYLIPVILILFLVFSELGLSSVSQKLTGEAARKHIVTAVNQTVKSEIAQSESEFLQIVRDESGRILSAQIQADSLNELKGSLSEKITKEINRRSSVSVPIGSLTGLAILNGRGFSVPLKLNFVGDVDITFQSSFESAGVNQSCHRITMQVHANVVSQSKRFEADASAEVSTVISETVIVGEVPNIYTSGKLS